MRRNIMATFLGLFLSLFLISNVKAGGELAKPLAEKLTSSIMAHKNFTVKEALLAGVNDFALSLAGLTAMATFESRAVYDEATFNNKIGAPFVMDLMKKYNFGLTGSDEISFGGAVGITFDEWIKGATQPLGWGEVMLGLQAWQHEVLALESATWTAKDGVSDDALETFSSQLLYIFESMEYVATEAMIDARQAEDYTTYFHIVCDFSRTMGEFLSNQTTSTSDYQNLSTSFRRLVEEFVYRTRNNTASNSETREAVRQFHIRWHHRILEGWKLLTDEQREKGLHRASAAVSEVLENASRLGFMPEGRMNELWTKYKNGWGPYLGEMQHAVRGKRPF